MRKPVQQELYRTKEAAAFTGLSVRTILEAIRNNKLYAFRQQPRGGRPGIYYIPRSALYAYIGHQGAAQLMQHFDWSQHRQLLKAADIRREISRVKTFEQRGAWAWDGQTNPLRSWRRHIGLSAYALGSQIGISERAIYGFERGGYFPRRRSLEAYSKVMGIPADDIYKMLDQWFSTRRLGAMRAPREEDQIIGAAPPKGATESLPARFPWVLAKLAEEKNDGPSDQPPEPRS